MTLTKRFSLIGIGIIIFLIITPMLILFARGFLFDFKHFKITKTGSLVIKTEPTKSEVFLNDQDQKKSTPVVIRLLIPADYNITIKKNDYQTWTKRLTIYPQLVTWTNQNREFTTLFYSTPKLYKTIPTLITQANKQKNKLAFSDGSNLFQLDLTDGSKINFGPTNQAIPPFDFNTPLVWENYAKIFPVLSHLQLNLISKQLQNIQTVETNGDYSAFLLNNQLFTNKGTDEFLLTAKDVQGFTLDNENIWYIQNTILNRLDLNTGNSEVVTANVPSANLTKVIRAGTNIFILTNNSLYNANGSLERITDNVLDAFWNNESKQLLITNNYEIYLYYPLEQKSELILRSSSPIKDAFLNPTTGYIFFTNENLIKAIELDGRDHRNIFSITKILPEQSFLVSENGKFLYLYDNKEIKILEIR